MDVDEPAAASQVGLRLSARQLHEEHPHGAVKGAAQAAA